MAASWISTTFSAFRSPDREKLKEPTNDTSSATTTFACMKSCTDAGVHGVEELREQSLAWARGETMTPKYFPHQIAFNVIPHIDKFVEGGYTGEEMKLVNEVRALYPAATPPDTRHPA